MKTVKVFQNCGVTSQNSDSLLYIKIKYFLNTIFLNYAFYLLSTIKESDKIL